MKHGSTDLHCVYFPLSKAGLSMLYILHKTNVKTGHIGLRYNHVQ